MDERRDFVRLKKRIKVMYKVIVDRFASTAVPPNITYTDTLSGNGMTFMSAKKIDEGVKLDITFEIEDGKKQGIDTAGVVLGSKQLDGGEHEIRVKFTDIDEPQKDRLARYVMREQVKTKKK